MVPLVGEGSDCKRALGGFWVFGNVLLLDLDLGYRAVVPW